MNLLIGTVAFVFALAALGYLSVWSGLLSQQSGEGLTDFAIAVALPLLLFRTMANADFTDSLPIALWLCYFSAAGLTWVVGYLMIIHLFGRDSRAGVVGGLSAGFSNLVLLGLPLIMGAYGDAGFKTLSLVVSIHMPVMIGVTVLLFALLGNSGSQKASPAAMLREIARTLFSNPLIIGILSGLLWRTTGFSLPTLIERLIDALAGVAGPVALFALGMGLNRHGIKGNIRPALAVAALKVILMPAIALIMAKSMGLTPISGKVAVVAASLPSGVSSYVIASRFGTGQGLASNAMTIGTLMAALSTAMWLAVAEWVFG